MSLWVFTVLSTPNFVVGFVLIWVFAVQLGLYPANGYVPVSAGIGQHLGSLLLPSLTLAAAPFALYQRVLRADLVETYGQEFMQVARAKGISPLRAAMRHAFRPSLLNLTTSVGVTVGVLIGSDVIVETLFSLPGLGAELAHSVSARDYAEVQGLVLVIAAAFVLINAAVDLIYGLIDPRLRARSRAVTR
jgi:peptide/nickel transport system permease protein